MADLDGHAVSKSSNKKKGLLPGLVTIERLADNRRAPPTAFGVEGVPEFRAGEEAYVFLWSREGEPQPHSRLVAGDVPHCKRCATGVETVTQDARRHLFFDPRTREFRRSGIRNLPVASFSTEAAEGRSRKRRRETFWIGGEAMNRIPNRWGDHDRNVLREHGYTRDASLRFLTCWYRT